jgi:hypothetical protein
LYSVKGEAKPFQNGVEKDAVRSKMNHSEAVARKLPSLSVSVNEFLEKQRTPVTRRSSSPPRPVVLSARSKANSRDSVEKERTSSARKRVFADEIAANSYNQSPVKGSRPLESGLAVFEPNSYLNRRIACRFGKTHCFGTISCYMPFGVSLKGAEGPVFVVQFDDKETYNYSRDEIEDMSVLYEQIKDRDRVEIKRRAALAKKRKLARPDDVDATSFVNRRIAKFFDDDLYYGTITSYASSPGEKFDELWHVLFDDGDEEDYEYYEVQRILGTYEQNPEVGSRRPKKK